MAAYLDVERFKKLTLMPPGDVSALEATDADFLPARLEARSSWLDARLAKRYAVPFDANDPPAVVVDWIVALVTLEAYLRRGFSPTSEQDALIVEAAKTAREEIKEAADAKEGLFELPLRQADTGTTAVTRGDVLSYTEASPYTWTDVELEAAREEDATG